MDVWNITLFSTLIIAVQANTAAQAKGEKPVAAPFGEYQVVALRNARDVASTPNPGAGTEWLGQWVSFGKGHLAWLGGETCGLWSVREADFPAITLEDPNLSDLAIPPVDSDSSSSDKRVNMSVDLICQDDRERTMGSFAIIDGRVLVFPAENGAVNLILEKTLTKKRISILQKQLKDMKFYDREISGELDEATLSSIGYYAEYRGSKFRFFRTAITENLLDGLGDLYDSPDEQRPR